ncbi:CobQ/CobB/MinD/ParA nucleotide binding domain protein [Peptostreptococcus anaerobius 653-L]|uniref:CobQ/CobB/MinD/ParA nucleotide binding domain protein n=1 Tax=Peptostreptococcus anaerobius 653-L TaxID=596329 RepID=D3MU61_9FIRM|nr:AAA family ATPase [Peptostreptococcus anaerobius]EFD04367.1 CobQ/CobB/MinD/ParA nucleotide binding domain protein [Peptostreptococcus anaerobius 653-L]
MGKVISVINMKGGVGKTTLSIGISDYISDIGKKVLIIDADPQFNATQALLDTYKSKDKDDVNGNFYTTYVQAKEKTIFRLFEMDRNIRDKFEMPSSDDIIISLKDNLDILCGDLSLVLANSISNHQYVNRIKKFIRDNKIREKYDYIFIDCPPTLTIYTDSALMASDYYLIPNKIDRYSIVGINSLQRAIDNLVSQEDIQLKCLGLVYTMVDKNNSVKQNQIKVDFESKDIVNDICIFTSVTTIVNDIQRGKRGPLPTKYKASREDIESISMELIKKLENDED